MAETDTLQQRLDKLRAVRARGTRRVRFDDREVEFRTDAELAAAQADLERQIAAASGTPKVVYLHSSKGL